MNFKNGIKNMEGVFINLEMVEGGFRDIVSC